LSLTHPNPLQLARTALTSNRANVAILAIACLLVAPLIARHGLPSAGIATALFLGAFASSIAGFAFSPICGAMLFHLDEDPVRLVQIMITCSIANQAIMTWAGRRAIEWRGLSCFLVGGAMGLGIGIWLLLNADRASYTHVLGVFLLGYGVYMLLRKPLVIANQHPALDLGAGFLGGITGGAAGFPGASVTIWCGMKGWDKVRQRAMFQPFILIMQVGALIGITVTGRSHFGGQGFDPANLLFVPASLLGTTLGLRLFSRLSDIQFSRAVNLLMIVSGYSYMA
jgi:uncharacterized membrane protein YfcA